MLSCMKLYLHVHLHSTRPLSFFSVSFSFEFALRGTVMDVLFSTDSTLSKMCEEWDKRPGSIIYKQWILVLHSKVRLIDWDC